MTSGTSASASAAKTSAPRAFRHGGGSFSDKIDAFTQERLKLCSALIGATATLAFAATVVQFARYPDAPSPLAFLSTINALSPLFVMACSAAAYVVLKRVKLSRRALAVTDVAFFLLGFSGPASFLVVSWRNGEGFAVHFMVIAVFARAIFVPSRPLRTFLVSAVAPVFVLVVELSLPSAWLSRGVPNPDPGFTTLWNQVVLWVSAGLAAYASHTSYALRLAAHEAGKVGQYELEEKIGEGAMGEVWRARHGLLRRPTAVKLIRAEIVDEKTRKRFEHEVRQTCRLSHPNVIAIYDYGHSEDGVFFYAMELLDGEDLGRVVRETGPMPAARAIHVLVQACEALAEAHAESLVHRDVKPANIMVTKRGLAFDVVKVMDFGLVKDTGGSDSGMTGVGEICGTPETIAPETIRGRAVGPAADIYALGAVGCWLLTGAHAFDAATPLEFVAAHLHTEPVRPSTRLAGVPADLEAVLLHCLRKDPADRPVSALALRDALLACADAGRWSRRDAADWWAARTAKTPFETLPEATGA